MNIHTLLVRSLHVSFFKNIQLTVKLYLKIDILQEI